MLAKRGQWQRENPGEPASGFGLTYDLNVPGRDPARSVNYPAFVDLGVYLMGLTHFLALLAADAAAPDAFMDLCSELSTDYTEFLLSPKPERFEALCGFGGDATCMLSPGLFERYGAGWDARLLEYARRTHDLPVGAPCNYHSCGASARDAELRDPHFVLNIPVHRPEGLPRLEQSIRACHAAMAPTTAAVLSEGRSSVSHVIACSRASLMENLRRPHLLATLNSLAVPARVSAVQAG